MHRWRPERHIDWRRIAFGPAAGSGRAVWRHRVCRRPANAGNWGSHGSWCAGRRRRVDLCEAGRTTGRLGYWRGTRGSGGRACASPSSRRCSPRRRRAASSPPSRAGTSGALPMKTSPDEPSRVIVSPWRTVTRTFSQSGFFTRPGFSVSARCISGGCPDGITSGCDMDEIMRISPVVGVAVLPKGRVWNW